MKKLSTKKLSTQLLIVIIISSFSMFLYFIISGYNNNIKFAQNNVLEKLHSITKTLAVGVNRQEHEYLIATYLEKDALKTSKQDSTYYNLHQLLKKVQTQNDIQSDIYTLFLNEKKELNFAITSGEKPYFRHSYSSAPKTILENFDIGASVGPYKDENGIWLSAFAPIKDVNGKTIAIVQADMLFNDFLISARKELYKDILSSTIVFLLSMGIVLFYVKKIAKIDEEKSKELNIAFAEVKSKNKDISDSINYAKRIQKALIPKQKEMKEFLPNSFILYEPKDVLSGDFPWYYKKQDYVYIAAVDCTGHGIPGAMLSIIGNLLLNDIVNNDHIISPADLLNKLHLSVVETLKQNSEDGIADGMDIALCRIDLRDNEVYYSGAHRPLYYWNTSEVLQYKGDKYPIGGVQYNDKNFFKDHIIHPKKGESIFFFSDGLQDQFDEFDRKIGPKKIRSIIEETKDFNQLEDSFRTLLLDWKGNKPQTDDVLMIGVKF